MTHEQMIQKDNSTKINVMYIAFELSNSKWKLAFVNGVKKRLKTVKAVDMVALMEEIEKSNKHFNLGEEVPAFTVVLPP
jgi:hypothetical protein